MFKKIKEHVLVIQWKILHHIGDFCFKKVEKCGLEHCGKWLELAEKCTIKEYEIIDKLFKFEEEAYI